MLKLQSEISNYVLGSSDKIESSLSQFKLEKSKTERPKRGYMLAEEKPQSLNETLSAQQKVICVSIYVEMCVCIHVNILN